MELGKDSKYSAALLALAAVFETSKDQKILPEAKAALLQTLQAAVPPHKRGPPAGVRET
jgi:hypothetical protein